MEPDQRQIEALLAAQLDDPRGLNQAVAIRAPHWAHSGIIGPGERRELTVGLPVDLICRLGAIGARWGLTRRPPGSSAEIHGTRLKPDVPGLYVAALEIAGFVRAVALAAVPVALLDRIGPAGGTNDRALTLRSRLNDPSLTTEALIRALESNNPAEWGGLAAPTH